MTDWADGIETRNYGIKSELDGSMLSEFLRTIFPLAMIACALLFCLWIRSEIVNTGYENQNLLKKQADLARIQRSLVLEEQTLLNPEQIDRIARNDLGMTPLRPSQFVLPQLQDVDRSLSNTVAMAGAKDADLNLVKPGVSGYVPAN